MSLSITTDLRSKLGPVKDQGRRPTCLAFASSAAHQHAQKHAEEFSVEWLYYHAVAQAGDGPNDGSQIPETRSVIAKPGQPLESEWPYLKEVVDVATWTPPSATVMFQHASTETTLSDFASTLKAGMPIVTALYLSDSFFNNNSWSRLGNQVILPDDSSPVDTSRGHAVVTVGLADLAGDQHFLLKNSWGGDWANDGHAWIRSQELERLFICAFSFNIGASHV